MHLVIFDLDGTLTDTNEVDSRSIVRALERHTGAAGLSHDWSSYTHSTDEGIVREVVQRAGHRSDRSLIDAIKSDMLDLMEQDVAACEDLMRPVEGARNILVDLERAGYAVAVATGSWRESALFKLRFAGIEHIGIPIATADDHESRVGIIRTAIGRAMERYGRKSFVPVTYVGDGVWDLEAARAMDIHFIGVASGEREATLRAKGATTIVKDLTRLKDALQ
jgi:phosphoglycolate phosphatase-like HAD superfamily hydrolase